MPSSTFSIATPIITAAVAIVGAYLGARTSIRNETRKTRADYLKNKISRLEIAKTKLVEFGISDQKQVSPKDAASEVAGALEDTFSGSSRTFREVDHYLDDGVTGEIKQRVEAVKEAIAKARAIYLGLLDVDDERQAGSVDGSEMIREMYAVIDTITSAVDKELRSSIGQFEKLSTP